MIRSHATSTQTGKLRRLASWLLILILIMAGFPPIHSSANSRIIDSTTGSLRTFPPAYFSTNYVSADTGDINTLDPALAYDTYSGQVIQNVYETLVFYNGASTTTFVPQLASSYELSVDGKTWTFHIRTGAKFHNGDSLTPADVAYSFRRGLLQGGSASPQWLLTEPFFGVGIMDIAELIAPDGSLDDNRAALMAQDPGVLAATCNKVKDAIVADNIAGTVTMHLAQPWGPFLGTISGTWGSIVDRNWAIARNTWDDSCANWQNWYASNSGEDPLTSATNGTGPFKMDHWTSGTEVVLARNDNYWRTPAQLEHVSILNIPDETTRFNMLQNGTADQAALSSTTIPLADTLVGEDCPWNVDTDQYNCYIVDPTKPLRRFIGRPGISQDEVIYNFNIVIPAGGNPYIGSGQLDGAGVTPDFFSDVHIRKAFNYCFDWNTFNSEVYGGSIVQPTTLLLEGMPGYDLNAAHYTFNPAECAAEFQASTLVGTGGQSLWNTGFHVQMLYNEGNSTRQRVAELLAAAIHAVNPKFVVDVVSLPWPDYLAAQSAGKIPIMTAGWMEDINDPHNWYQPYLLGAYANRSHIPVALKAQFKVLIDQGVSATTFAARDTIYKQLNQLIYDNAMFILLGGATNHGFVQRRVHGIVPNIMFPGRYYYTIYKDPLNLIFLPLVLRNSSTMCSVAPTLIYPPNGSSLDNLIPLFQWDNGHDPSATAVRMDVARDPGFTQIVLNLWGGYPQGPDQVRYEWNLDPGTLYYWRAYLMCGDSLQSPYSATWSFTSGSGGTILPAPNLVAPPNGAVLPTASTTLEWTPVSGAVEYFVLWSVPAGGGYISTTTGTQLIPFYLDANKTYEWYAAARNDYAWGNDSLHWTFTTGAGASSLTHTLPPSSVLDHVTYIMNNNGEVMIIPGK